MLNRYFLASALALLSVATVRADVFNVTTAAEFNTVFKQIGLTDESRDTVFIHSSPEGCRLSNMKCSNGGKNTYMVFETFEDEATGTTSYCYYPVSEPNPYATPHRGKVWYIGVDDEVGNKAVFTPSWYYQNYDSLYNMSWYFENLDLRCPSGIGTSKSYLARFDRNTAYFDTIMFKNCDINENGQYLLWFTPIQVVRRWYNPIPGEEYSTEHLPAEEQIYKTTTDYLPNGYISYFGMIGCKVHGRNSTASFYSGSHWFGEIDIRDNTFYDLVGSNSLFSMGRFSDDQLCNTATNVVFSNNCVYTAIQQNTTLFNFGNKIGPMSTFEISNNILMRPNWTNDLNLEDSGTKTYVVNAYEALVYAYHNVVDTTYGAWDRYNLPYDAATDPEYGKWYACDTVGNMTPEEIGLSWNDMLSPETGDFYLLNTHPAGTAGLDGAPVGAPYWYVDHMAAKVNVSVSLEGSECAILNFMPQKTQYYEGDVILISVDTRGLCEFIGWSDGSSEPTREITLGTEDLTLVGTCKDYQWIAVYDFVGCSNNQALTLPYEPNHTHIPGVFMTFYNWDDSIKAYVAQPTATARTNKITTPSYLIQAKTPIQFIDSIACPHYYQFEVPTTDYKGITFMVDVATDYYASASMLVQYSFDAQEWVTVDQVNIVPMEWTTISTKMPSACNGCEKVYFRVISNAADPARVTYGDIQPENMNEEFLMYTNIAFYYDEQIGNGISVVKTDSDNANGAIYDLMGRVVGTLQPGHLYIQHGRRFMVK